MCPHDREFLSGSVQEWILHTCWCGNGVLTGNKHCFHKCSHNLKLALKSWQSCWHQIKLISHSGIMTSNCSFEEVDNLMKYLELIIYIPIFLFGLILNVVALLVFCIFLRKWTESTIYMSSLALMDLLLLFPLPFKMHATNHLWPAELQTLCSILESLYFVGIYGSIYTIMCIAVDRWVAICHPFKAKQMRSPKAALGTCMGVWMLVLVTISSTTYRFRRDGQSQFHCFHVFSKDGWNPVVIIFVQVFGFLLPALVVIYCSVNTIWVLQQSGQRSPNSRACVKIIYSSLGAFLVPFTPSHLAILLQFLVRKKNTTSFKVN